MIPVVDYAAWCRRAPVYEGVEDSVRAIVDAVRRDGDAALVWYTRQFDRVELRRVRVSREGLAAANVAAPAD